MDEILAMMYNNNNKDRSARIHPCPSESFVYQIENDYPLEP